MVRLMTSGYNWMNMEEGKQIHKKLWQTVKLPVSSPWEALH
jgi:hypothetical protein